MLTDNSIVPEVETTSRSFCPTGREPNAMA